MPRSVIARWHDLSDEQRTPSNLLSLGVSCRSRQAEIGSAVNDYGNDLNTGIRVVEVENLGWASALVDIEGETVLFLDIALSGDERCSIMADVMAGSY